MRMTSLRDSFGDVAFTTAVPFDDEGSTVRYDSLKENILGLYDAGARLFVPCGNTGEYYSLTDEERIAVVECHVQATGDDATIVAGAGGNVNEIATLANAYEEVGADAVMVMHPNHPFIHEAGLIEYYHRICDCTELGVVIYKRGPEVTRNVIVELSGRENLVAVKFAVDDVKEFSQTVEDASSDVTWVNGIAERYAVSFAISGANGYTTGIGNFVPNATLALHKAIRNNQWSRARWIQQLLRPLEDLREETGEGNTLPAANNVPVIKYGMEIAGYTGGPVREPLAGLSEGDERRVEECYDEIVDATVQGPQSK